MSSPRRGNIWPRPQRACVLLLLSFPPPSLYVTRACLGNDSSIGCLLSSLVTNQPRSSNYWVEAPGQGSDLSQHLYKNMLRQSGLSCGWSKLYYIFFSSNHLNNMGQSLRMVSDFISLLHTMKVEVSPSFSAIFPQVWMPKARPVNRTPETKHVSFLPCCAGVNRFDRCLCFPCLKCYLHVSNWPQFPLSSDLKELMVWTS